MPLPRRTDRLTAIAPMTSDTNQPNTTPSTASAALKITRIGSGVARLLGVVSSA